MQNVLFQTNLNSWRQRRAEACSCAACWAACRSEVCLVRPRWPIVANDSRHYQCDLENHHAGYCINKSEEEHLKCTSHQLRSATHCRALICHSHYPHTCTIRWLAPDTTQNNRCHSCDRAMSIVLQYDTLLSQTTWKCLLLLFAYKSTETEKQREKKKHTKWTNFCATRINGFTFIATISFNTITIHTTFIHLWLR